jgi:hypothetical protein
VTELGSRLRGSRGLRFSSFAFVCVSFLEKVPFKQPVAFESSRVAAPTFWKRVGGFHENCLRLARYRLLEIKAVSANRVVFVARSFFEMLGTPKGRCVCQLRGSPFFAYFLRLRYESELSPGNPRLGRRIIVTQPTPGANHFAQRTRVVPSTHPPFLLFFYFALWALKQIWHNSFHVTIKQWNGKTVITMRRAINHSFFDQG